jgi:hypothetical protein
VQQFWDPKHDVSKALRQMASSSSFEPGPNSGKGFYWDEAILFRPHAKWSDSPAPLFWRGPVFEVIHPLNEAIQNARRAAQ